MRIFLFEMTSRFFAGLIGLTQGFSRLLCSAYGNIGSFVLSRIDKRRLQTYKILLENAEKPSETSNTQLELKLLASASQVRDHAQETGDWTDHHTEAISAIGEALVMELDWEEDYVHQYLKEVVESIEGLEYES